MHKIFFAFVVSLIVFANVAAQTEQTDWIEFAPEGGGFSILLPSKPVETITKKTAYTLHSFTTTLDRATYVVAYTDYEQVKLPRAAFLAANRDKFNKGLQATLISSREIILDGHTGVEFTSENPAANIKSQLFLIGNRLFQTATMVFKDVEQSSYIDRYFASFKFTK
jgi:hypothetical protein